MTTTVRCYVLLLLATITIAVAVAAEIASTTSVFHGAAVRSAELMHNGFALFAHEDYHPRERVSMWARHKSAPDAAAVEKGGPQLERKNRGFVGHGTEGLLSHGARPEEDPIHVMLQCTHGTRMADLEKALLQEPAEGGEGTFSTTLKISLVQKVPHPVFLVVVTYGTFHRFLDAESKRKGRNQDDSSSSRLVVLWEEIHPHSKISQDLHPQAPAGGGGTVTEQGKDEDPAAACPGTLDVVAHLVQEAPAPKLVRLITRGAPVADEEEEEENSRWPKEHCRLYFGAKERLHREALLLHANQKQNNISSTREEHALLPPPNHKVVRVVCDLEAICNEKVDLVGTTPEIRCRQRTQEIVPEILSYLAHLPWVKWVEPRPHFQTQNSVATVTLQSPTLTNRPLWSHHLTGSGQVGQVGDTGLDFDSCFFRDTTQEVSFYPVTNPKHRKVLSYVECDNDVHIDHTDAVRGHGTHVSGSVAGNSLGGSISFNGMAKDAKLVFSDMNCANGEEGVFPPGDIHDYYGVGRTIGARTSSNSWGVINRDKTYSATERNSDHFVYYHQDFLLVFAAGNYANAGIITPSSGKNMLTVGAHYNSLDASKREIISGFSAVGPAYDGKIKPEIMAPGDKITSATSDGRLDSNQCETHALSGTSMATPLVAGSALIVRQYFQEGFYPTGVKNYSNPMKPTASLIKAAMVQGAVPMTSQAGWPSAKEGFGRLELNKVLYVASGAGSTAGTHPYSFLINNQSIAHAQTRSFCFSTTTSTPSAVSDIKATLTWMDPPLIPEGSAGATVVNDLDLTLVNPLGQTIHPNSKTDFDHHVNNVEVISTSVASGAGGSSGKFILHIHGHHIEDDGSFYKNGQPFSLIAWAPNLKLEDMSKCAAFKCPKSCSGHGTCDSGRCTCKSPYHHVDCSFCDARIQCHGNGVCDTAGVCICNANFDATADPNCGKCKAGWYGPHCDSQCKCGHGSCNTTTGMCACNNTATSSKGAPTHYGGAQCERCQFDWYGPECSIRSHWCLNKKLRVIETNSSGLIQLNGQGHYVNGDACGWRIKSPQPQWTLKLKFTWFDIEASYDHLRVYDGADRSSVLLANYDGTKGQGKELTTSGNEVLLLFRSDYIGPGNGFTIEYSVVKHKCLALSCHGHGHCDTGTDLCTCDTNYDPATSCAQCVYGYQGSTCATKMQFTTPQPSENNPFRTVAPSQRTCVEPGTVQDCSGHGYCHSGTKTCECDNHGYSGDYCERTCPAISLQKDIIPSPCSGHGMCGSDVTCSCQDNYLGRSCQVNELAVQWLNVKHASQRIVLQANALALVGYHPILPEDTNFERSVIVQMSLQTIPKAIPTSASQLDAASSGSNAVTGAAEEPAMVQGQGGFDEQKATKKTPTTSTSAVTALPPPNVEFLLWADALDVGLDVQAIHKSDFTGSHCVESKGWSTLPLTPTLMGIRCSEDISVEVTFSQRVVRRCGATAHSLCSTTICTAGNDAALESTSTNSAAIPEQKTSQPSVGDQVAAAFKDKTVVAMSVLGGIVVGMIICLVIHCSLVWRKRYKNYARATDEDDAPDGPTDDSPTGRPASEEMGSVGSSGGTGGSNQRVAMDTVYSPQEGEREERREGGTPQAAGGGDEFDDLERHNEPLGMKDDDEAVSGGRRRADVYRSNGGRNGSVGHEV